LCDVNIDGQGKLLLGVAHGDDNVPQHRESSVSHSSRSSVYKRAEFRGDVSRNSWLKQFSRKIQGAAEANIEPGLDLGERHQVLVYAATGTNIIATIKATGA